MVISAGVNGDGVSHHFGGYAVGEAHVDGADGPSMAQIVGRKGHAITPKLSRDALPNPLKGGGIQVGSNVGEDKRSQVKLIHPFGMKRPDVVASSLGAGQNSDLLSALGEIAVVTEKDFVVSQSEGCHDTIDRSPCGIWDFAPVV